MPIPAVAPYSLPGLQLKFLDYAHVRSVDDAPTSLAESCVSPAVASLRLVSRGAATDGVTYFFVVKKLTDYLFSHRPLQSDDLFLAF